MRASTGANAYSAKSPKIPLPQVDCANQKTIWANSNLSQRRYPSRHKRVALQAQGHLDPI
jgi:hypothetical protein